MGVRTVLGLQARDDVRIDPSSRCQTTRVRLTASDRATDAKITFADELTGSRLVEPDGIEPTTSCLQSRRSPN
jgi:hypothetical protein